MARRAYGGKTTVESCLSVDVLRWNRLGYLRSSRWFSWAWTRDGERVASINVEAGHHSVTLKYRIRSYGEDWSDVEQRVAIAWTPCRFGGARPWFMCSVQSNGVYCGRRVTKLYGVGRLFACRHCYRLAYTSQQESARDRGLWLIQLAVAKSLFVSVLVSFEMVVFNFVKPRMSMATIPWISIFRFIPIWRSSLPQPVLLEV